MSHRASVSVSALALVGGLLVGALASQALVLGQGHVNHVVYFKAAPSTDLLSPAALTQALGSDPYYTYAEVDSWSAVLDAHASEQIDVLIVDSGSFQLLDEAWVADAYWTGTSLSGIRVEAWQLVHLVGEPRYSSTGPQPPSLTDPEMFSALGTGFFGAPEYVAAAVADPVAAREGTLVLPTSITGETFSFRTKVYTAIDGATPFYANVRRYIERKNQYTP